MLEIFPGLFGEIPLLIRNVNSGFFASALLPALNQTSHKRRLTCADDQSGVFYSRF